MSYKIELQGNNVDLQSILNTINAMEGGSEVESTFTPTDSGGSSYKSKLSDNNIDLQRVLEMALSLPYASDTPTLITFTIDGTSYQAEEGMTWAEWVESDYNTFAGSVFGENTAESLYVGSNDDWVEYTADISYGYIIYMSTYDFVYGGDVIGSNTTYGLYPYG